MTRLRRWSRDWAMFVIRSALCGYQQGVQRRPRTLESGTPSGCDNKAPRIVKYRSVSLDHDTIVTQRRLSRLLDAKRDDGKRFRLFKGNCSNNLCLLIIILEIPIVDLTFRSSLILRSLDFSLESTKRSSWASTGTLQKNRHCTVIICNYRDIAGSIELEMECTRANRPDHLFDYRLVAYRLVAYRSTNHAPSGLGSHREHLPCKKNPPKQPDLSRSPRKRTRLEMHPSITTTHLTYPRPSSPHLTSSLPVPITFPPSHYYQP